MPGTANATEDDAALLGRYRVERSQAAFAALVERHGGMVRATCARALGRRHPAVDDACQAVFEILARRADRIRDARALAGWLHTTARGVVANLGRAERRRARAEQAAGTLAAAPTWRAEDERAWLIDEAIASLSPIQRDAVLRRYLEQRTPAELAAELGCSESAAMKRVADATARLRTYFARRGVSAAGVAVLLAAGRDGATAEAGPAIASGGGATAHVVAEAALRALAAWRAKAMAALAACLLVGAIAALAPWRATPPRPVAADARQLAERALLAPIRALRRGDVAALVAALPAEDRARVRDDWQVFAGSAPRPADAAADAVLALLRTPGGEQIVRPLLARMPSPASDLADLLRAVEAPAGAASPLAAAIREMRIGLDALPELDHRAAAAVVDARVVTARAFGIEGLVEMRELALDEAIGRWSGVLIAMKGWFRPHGIDVDAFLDSFAVVAARGDGDRIDAVLAFSAFGRRHELPLRLRITAEGAVCDELRPLLGLALHVVVYARLEPPRMDRDDARAKALAGR